MILNHWAAENCSILLQKSFWKCHFWHEMHVDILRLSGGLAPFILIYNQMNMEEIPKRLFSSTQNKVIFLDEIISTLRICGTLCMATWNWMSAHAHILKWYVPWIAFNCEYLNNWLNYKFTNEYFCYHRHCFSEFIWHRAKKIVWKSSYIQYRPWYILVSRGFTLPHIEQSQHTHALDEWNTLFCSFVQL